MPSSPRCAAMPMRCANGSSARPAGRCTSNAMWHACTSARPISTTPPAGCPATSAAAMCCCASPARCWSEPTRRSHCTCSATGCSPWLRSRHWPRLASASRSRRSTSGASWSRCAAHCSSSASCIAWPVTKRASCAAATKAPTVSMMRSTTCSGGSSPACSRHLGARPPGPPTKPRPRSRRGSPRWWRSQCQTATKAGARRCVTTWRAACSMTR